MRQTTNVDSPVIGLEHPALFVRVEFSLRRASRYNTWYRQSVHRYHITIFTKYAELTNCAHCS